MYKDYTVQDVRDAAEKKLFTVVSLFAGGGGSSTGYKLAGGDIRCINEFQQIAVDTYLANYPNTKYICEDIREVSGSDLLDLAGLERGELDILDGSPPCPPFSASGTKRKGWDKEKVAYGKKMKNIEDLSFDMVRICGEIQPKTFVCENVKGLTYDYARDHMNRIINAFEDCGYNVTFKVLNASHYGVPQSRERLFMIGVRDDICESLGYSFLNMESLYPEPNFPAPTQKDAIHDLLYDSDNQREGEFLENEMARKPKHEYLVMMPKNPKKVESIGDYHPKNSHYQSRRVPWDRPSHTLSEIGLQLSLAVHIHPSKDRGFTTYESIKLMSLPSDYELVGTLNEKLARVGLMVAPYQLKSIAENLYEKVLKYGS